MNSSLRRLILLTARFQRAAAAVHEAHELAADFDAAFDGGEWSHAAHHRAAERAADQLAGRFGFASADAAYAVAEFLGVRSSNQQFLHEGTVNLPA